MYFASNRGLMEKFGFSCATGHGQCTRKSSIVRVTITQRGGEENNFPRFWILDEWDHQSWGGYAVFYVRLA